MRRTTDPRVPEGVMKALIEALHLICEDDLQQALAHLENAARLIRESLEKENT